jgi:hypothetical protein
MGPQRGDSTVHDQVGQNVVKKVSRWRGRLEDLAGTDKVSPAGRFCAPATQGIRWSLVVAVLLAIDLALSQF